MSQPANPSSGRRKVLVIEDSPVQSKIIRKQIEALSHFQTACATSMVEAREVLARDKDSLCRAVVDLKRPDAPDGEAADLALEHGLPVIVLTAPCNEDIRKQFLSRRVADYFFKGSIRDMDPMMASLERLYKNQSVKVLVVDDSRTELGYMAALLKTQLFQVLEAGDGRQALEVLERHPDLEMIITDYNMPHVDGFELVKTVRERHKKDKIAIIGVSAAGSGALSAMFLKNGANDFLTKPFEAEEFYCRVNQNIEMLELVRELQECLGQ